jgi:CRP/FNR family transcriptional regulator, cyclic AMP receptor protein
MVDLEPLRRDNGRVLRKDAKIELLRRVPLFELCSKRELREIASIADELPLPAGKGLAREGAPGHEFMVVVEGSAEVRRGGRRINLLGAGDFLGEIALITGRKRTASVTTLEPTRLLVITERDFRRLIRDVPSIQPKVMQALASRLEADD